MKKNILYTALIFLTGIVLYSCGLTDTEGKDPQYLYFKIEADSIAFANDSVTTNDTLVVRFWGDIGSDECFEFDHFQTFESAGQMNIIIWGRETRGSVDCETGEQNLNGKEYRIYPVSTGEYKIVVYQPGGGTFVKEIFIL